MDEETLLKQILELAEKWGASTREALEVFRDEAPTALNAVREKLSELIRHQGDLSDKAKIFVDYMKDPELQQKIAILARGMDGVGEALRRGVEKGEKAFDSFVESRLGEDISVQLGLDLSLFKTQFAEAKKLITDPNNLKVAASFALADTAKDEIDKVAKLLDTQLSPLFKFDRDAAEGLGALANPLGGLTDSIDASAENATAPLKGVRDFFKRELIDASMEFGTSLEDNSRSLRELARSVPNIDIIRSLRVKEGTEEVKGLTAALSIAKATGLQIGEVGEIIGQMTRSLGVAPEEIGERFQLLSQAAADTGMSTQEMVDEVRVASREMRFFGDNTASTAAEFNVFARALGTGRIENAKELFRSMTSSIANMNDGMKAFLGMSSSIGQGGGALESVLRFEEAMSSGQGLEDIRKSITDQVEQLSGSQLMTRKEAIASGQEQSYFVQRQLLSQQTGVQGAGQLDQLIEVLKSRDEGSLARLQAIAGTDQGEGTGLISRGRERAAVDRSANPLAFARGQAEALTLATTLDYRGVGPDGQPTGAGIVDNMLEGELRSSDAARRQVRGGENNVGMMSRAQQFLSNTMSPESLADESDRRLEYARENRREVGGALGLENASNTTQNFSYGPEVEIARRTAGNRGYANENSQTDPYQTTAGGQAGMDMATMLQQKTAEVIANTVQSTLDGVAKAIKDAMSTPQTVNVTLSPTQELRALLDIKTQVDSAIKSNSVRESGFER